MLPNGLLLGADECARHGPGLHFIELLLMILNLQLFGLEVLHGPVVTHLCSHEVTCLLFPLVVLGR